MIKVTWKTRIVDGERFVDEILNGEVLGTFGPMEKDVASLWRAVRSERLHSMVLQHTLAELEGIRADKRRQAAFEEFRRGE